MKHDPIRTVLTDAQRILVGHLHRHCGGRARARTYARLRDDLVREAGLVIGEREMYELVQGLVLAGRPVGTVSAGGGGAFIVETARDARLAYRNLYGRVCRQLRRCRAFKRTIRETLSGQRYLDLVAAENAYDDARRAVEARRRLRVNEVINRLGVASKQQGLLFGGLAPGSRT
jgi:hypothetical protein